MAEERGEVNLDWQTLVARHLQCSRQAIRQDERYREPGETVETTSFEKGAAAEVRRATPEDIELLLGMLREHFTTEKDLVFNPAIQRKGLLLLLSDPARYCVVVALRGGAALGMGVAQTLFDRRKGSLSVEVEDILVLRQWRRFGTGRLLLDALNMWATSLDLPVVSMVAHGGEPPLSFYEQLNWESTQNACLRIGERRSMRQVRHVLVSR